MNEHINEIFRFRSLPVYQESRSFRKIVKDYTKQSFPKEEQYALTSQLWRSLDSVVLNIAEGMDRFSGKGNSVFLNYSIGSLDEAVSCLDCALDDGYIGMELHEKFLSNASQIMRQLKALCATIRRNDRSN
jgi:four helix bundle protein